MSMIGEYLRVTAAELDRAIQDPDWASDFAEEETDPAPAEARHLSTYKTWDMLRFLFLPARAEFPVNVIHGEERRARSAGAGPSWVRHGYDGLTRFFEAAAGANDAGLVWLD
ncbi:DUF1877 family protein [Streptomyces populi]